jgi:D-sedoheptulose 7-phosphate isomerase
VNADQILKEAMQETGERLTRLAQDSTFQDQVATASAVLTAALAERHTVFSCGNGGSMCDAMHFAEELTGRFRDDRPALPATAISDPGYLTCAANDFGYEQLFSRYLEAHARNGDVLIALSTSGKSPNVIAAARTMHEYGGKVIALTGRAGSPLGELADVDICVGTTGYADRAQEVHIVVLHSLIQSIEQELFASGQPATA